MSMAMLVICLVSGGSSFMSFLFNRRKPTKMRQRITCVLAVISFFSAIASGVLGYWSSVETADQLKLAHDQGSETIERVERAEE